MSLQRLTPRVLPRSFQTVPVIPTKTPTSAIAWLITAFAAVPAVVAITDRQIGSRWVMAALAVLILTVGVCLHVMFRSIRQGSVTVADNAAELRFTPGPAATMPTNVIALALLLPAIARGAVDVLGMPTSTTTVLLSRGPYVLGAIGIAVLATNAWRLRVPAGLEVTAHGLRGIRGCGGVDASWDQIGAIAVVAAPAAKLSLEVRGTKVILAPAIKLGSDPNVVAAIVGYYREHPAERAMLGSGAVEAVRHVEKAVAAEL